MKALIKNYRRGRHTMYGNQFIVLPAGIASREDAAKLVGMKAVWTTTSGKEIIGKVVRSHGGKGAVRVRFNKGLPGQAIGTPIKLRAKGEKPSKKPAKKPVKKKAKKKAKKPVRKVSKKKPKPRILKARKAARLKKEKKQETKKPEKKTEKKEKKTEKKEKKKPVKKAKPNKPAAKKTKKK